MDRYECGQGLRWSDGWRWIAKDGDGTSHLFEVQPGREGRGRSLKWTSPRGRKARMPFHVPNLARNRSMMIDFEADIRLANHRTDRHVEPLELDGRGFRSFDMENHECAVMTRKSKAVE